MADYVTSATEQLSLLINKIGGKAELKGAVELANGKIEQLKLQSGSWDDYMAKYSPESYVKTVSELVRNSADADEIKGLLDQLFAAIGQYGKGEKQFYMDAFSAIQDIAVSKKGVYPISNIITRMGKIPETFRKSRKGIICNDPKNDELEKDITIDLAEKIRLLANSDSEAYEVASKVLNALTFGGEETPSAIIYDAFQKARNKQSVQENIGKIVETAKKYSHDKNIMKVALEDITKLYFFHVITSQDTVKPIKELVESSHNAHEEAIKALKIIVPGSEKLIRDWDMVLAIYETVGKEAKLTDKKELLKDVIKGINDIIDNTWITLGTRDKATLLLIKLDCDKTRLIDMMNYLKQASTSDRDRTETFNSTILHLMDESIRTIKLLKEAGEEITEDKANDYDKDLIADYLNVIDCITALAKSNYINDTDVNDYMTSLAGVFIYKVKKADSDEYEDKTCKEVVTKIADYMVGNLADKKNKSIVKNTLKALYDIIKDNQECTETKKEIIKRIQTIKEEHTAYSTLALDYICKLSDDKDLKPEEVLHKHKLIVLESVRDFNNCEHSPAPKTERENSLKTMGTVIADKKDDEKFVLKGMRALLEILSATDTKSDTGIAATNMKQHVYENVFKAMVVALSDSAYNLDLAFIPILHAFSVNSQWLSQAADALNEIGKKRNPLSAMQIMAKLYIKHQSSTHIQKAESYIKEREEADGDKDKHYKDYMYCLVTLPVSGIGFQGSFLKRLEMLYGFKDMNAMDTMECIADFHDTILPLVMEKDLAEKQSQENMREASGRTDDGEDITNEQVLNNQCASYISMIKSEIKGDKSEADLTEDEKTIIGRAEELEAYFNV